MATSWAVRKLKRAAVRFVKGFIPKPVQKAVEKAAAAKKKAAQKEAAKKKKTTSTPKKKAPPKWVGPKLKMPPPPSPRRSKVIRQASLEWSNGEHLMPEVHPGVHWTDHFVAPKDQDHYRALIEGCWVDFAAWPNDAGDPETLKTAALERAVYLYGDFALTWAVQDVRLVSSAADRAAEADTEEASAP
jgi:hypothetical protein